MTVRDALVTADYETWQEMDKLQSIGDTTGLDQLSDAKLITRAREPSYCL
ncbi:MAG TPA: hypothetical protein VGG64_22310 [Pirellulales bacterium]